MKIVRPLESTVETQPQLQPASLRLSAIISQPTLLKNGSNQVQRSLVDISRVETFELLAGADARWPHRLATASPSRRGLEAYIPFFNSVAASSSADSLLPPNMRAISSCRPFPLTSRNCE